MITDVKKIHFDGTVNLGHILTMLGMLAAVVTLWINFNSKVDAATFKVNEHNGSIHELQDVTKKLTENQAYLTGIIQQMNKNAINKNTFEE